MVIGISVCFPLDMQFDLRNAKMKKLYQAINLSKNVWIQYIEYLIRAIQVYKLLAMQSVDLYLAKIALTLNIYKESSQARDEKYLVSRTQW